MLIAVWGVSPSRAPTAEGVKANTVCAVQLTGLCGVNGEDFGWGKKIKIMNHQKQPKIKRYLGGVDAPSLSVLWKSTNQSGRSSCFWPSVNRP